MSDEEAVKKAGSEQRRRRRGSSSAEDGGGDSDYEYHHNVPSPSRRDRDARHRRYQLDSPVADIDGAHSTPSLKRSADRRSNSPVSRSRGDGIGSDVVSRGCDRDGEHAAKRRREDHTVVHSSRSIDSFERSSRRDATSSPRRRDAISPASGRGRQSDEEDRRSPSPYRSSRRSHFYGGRDRYRGERDTPYKDRDSYRDRDGSPGRRNNQYSRRGGFYYGGRRRDYDDDDRRRGDTGSHRGGDVGTDTSDVKPSTSQPLSEEERKRKEIEDARRDDLTVLVVNLSLKATEKDIWQFFTKHAGKVRDIQLIKDARSGKSKGIGYVEFHDAESVLKSLNLTGQCVLNQPIRVQASQAEKNRAAKAAKQQQAELAAQGPTKIYVGGLIDSLAGITSDELRQLFSPFGSILQIDIPKDPYTGRSRGYAFVQFKNAQEAREAMTAMHGFDIGGKQIKVGFAGEEQRSTSTSSTVDGSNGIDLDKIADDHDDRLLHGGAMTRLQLSQKLQQKSSDQIPLLSSAAAQLMTAADIQATIQSASKSAMQTPMLCLANMFTREEILEEGIDMLDDVVDDVKNECAKFGGVLEVWVDREALDGKVLVKFADVQSAASSFKGLNGRFFGGAAIVVSYISDAQWRSQVGDGS
eukprot:Gregarina_sp_Poly_1__2659@NODE_1726_length_3453_cov_243_116952_g1090_i1_p1_GENE_NODE_1726_length_3453_cov_243_116952_g1090_i1NODE_1726_length_3453_cov_243_116952_g1090_i1_p1_ORF_typecomplete_len639_score108_25RRM_1/PF00076_22/9_5e14RRM_1/PF00076_22/1_7e21RRM_1/PF00076_22/0_0042RRM_5/PF13893_6/0_0034RRM_5/PF13893_6/1_4e09RRM_5/PF13893_6/2_8e03RRM_5/PF13893_6/0_76RRM_7/PF16367_5/0_2RRM_7/PF16367_5/6_4e06Limkainb1/PF11608_8/12Limkainb1/PF11608_8/5_6e05Limkainb1/PF11608_8/12RRM_8/PF11835_8/1_6e03RRM